MEISHSKAQDLLTIALVGRLDANWCDHVEKSLMSAVRSGEHQIHLDMSGVPYISSAGLRVLFMAYKQLLSIKGSFIVVNPSPTVRSVLDLSGLAMIIADTAAPAAALAETADTHGREAKSAHARYEIFGQASKTPASLDAIGDASWLTNRTASPATRASFPTGTFALGVGALGSEEIDSQSRYGELLAVAGIAAFQPSDGSSRPDFVLSEGALVPEGFLPVGLRARIDFSLLARFETERSVTLSELAENALAFADSDTAVVVALTETAGLVGASLRKAPASATAGEAPLGFPQIREWLNFTTERAYRDSTSLVVGVVSRNTHPLLRPLGRQLQGHFHAASFPYRPLQKGRIDLAESVKALFEAHNLQAVLHLLSDTREFSGAGESEFLRGALWIAPANFTAQT